MDICARIFQLISDRGITAYRVAKDTGITEAALSVWKSGKSAPSIGNYITLADYFDVSLDYLVGRSDDPFCKCGRALRDHDDIVLC